MDRQELIEKLDTASGQQRLELLIRLIRILTRENDAQVIDYSNEALDLIEEFPQPDYHLEILRNLSRYYLNIKDFKNAEQCIFQAIEIARYSRHEILIADTYSDAANVSMFTAEFNRALDYGEKSLKIYFKKGNKEKIAKVCNTMGTVYWKIDDYQKALEKFYLSLNAYNDLSDELSKAQLLNNIGLVYMSMENYEDALQYFQESLGIRKEIDDKRGLCESYSNLGVVNDIMDNSKQSLDYFKIAYQLSNDLKDKQMTSGVLNDIGFQYEKMEKFSIAMNYYKQSLQLKREMSDSYGICSILNSLSNICLRLKNYPLALNYAEEGMYLAEQIQSKGLMINAYKMMGEVYEVQKDYQTALTYYSKYGHLYTNLNNQDLEKSLEEQRARFDQEYKRKETEIYNQKNIELAEANDKLQKALDQVKKLSGLLPICPICKKIRDQEGYWKQVEEYISVHSELEFTHGLCEKCKEEYLKELEE